MSLEGQLIDRYRISSLLGSGGMGDVYLAEDARIEQLVAMKVIKVDESLSLEKQQEATRLFQREARAIVKLDHPYILPLYDYGEQRLGKLLVIYLVMPYRPEGSLVDWLRQRARLGKSSLLTPEETVHVVNQAASALQHAHNRQVIHQDVKLSNFLLRESQETSTFPDLLLSDFGIARITSSTSSISQSIRGTPAAMAPEQWQGHPVPATDQYALAVMVYELLAGRPPFQGAPGPLMFQHLSTPPPPIRSLKAGLPPEIDAVLLQALSKQPEERFANVSAFARAFALVVQSRSVPSSTPVAHPSGSGDIQATLAISSAEASTGTVRMLTLPGGRQLSVSIPAGVQDGQMIRVEGQGEQPSSGGADGALIIMLIVKADEFPAHITSAEIESEPTMFTAPPPEAVSTPPEAATPDNPPLETASEALASLAPTIPAPAIQLPSTRTEPELPSAPAPRSRSAISRRALIIALAGAGIAGGVGLTWWLLRPSSTGIVTTGSPSSTRTTATMGSTPESSPATTPEPTTTTLNSTYTYTGHRGKVSVVAYSPADGTRIASGGDDTTVQVWNAADGGNVYTYTGHHQAVYALAWSPDGTRIVSGANDGGMQVWDAADGGHVLNYAGHHSPVIAVAWSPDGSHIASGDENGVQIWNAADGTTIYTSPHPGYAVAWSPNSKRVASGGFSSAGVQVWDAADGGNLFTYTGQSEVTGVAWSPDGARIASGGPDKTVQVWDAADGGHVFTYRGHTDSVNKVAWSPNGKYIASGGIDSTVQVWDATDASNVFTYRGSVVNNVAWSPDSRQAAVATDTAVQILVMG